MSELENFLRREIKNIVLSEKKEKSDKEKPGRRGNIKRGKIGGGKIKDKIKEAGALAADNPKELMNRLGISGAPGGASDLDKVVSLIRSAIFGNDTMQQAYGGAKISTYENSKVVEVITRKITARDGALYVLHTLTGASNAGLLPQLSSEIKVGNYDGRVLVIFN